MKLLLAGMMNLWSIFLIVKLGAELMSHPVDESIRDRKPIHSGVESSLNNLSKDESFKNTNDYYNSNDFSSGTFEQASAPPLPFPPQSVVLILHLLPDTYQRAA